VSPDVTSCCLPNLVGSFSFSLYSSAKLGCLIKASAILSSYLYLEMTFLQAAARELRISIEI